MPAVIDAINQYRMGLDQLERSQATRLAAEWALLARGLNEEVELLAAEAAERAAHGLPVRLWHLQRMDRYQSLMRQIGQTVEKYARYAQADIMSTERTMIRQGLEHSQRLIDLQTPTLTMMFDRLPVDAFEGMIGNTAAGTPLASLFSGHPKETGQAVTRALLNGTGLGWHPTKTAREMRDRATLSYQRSVLIARTEQMRVYREVSRQQYIASKIVEGYRRVASKTSRTCIGCLLMDGMFFPLSEPFEEHPAGRCSAVPVVQGNGAITWETGEEWFLRQSQSTQREMLGPGRYNAWRSGRVNLQDMVTKRIDDVWGNSYVPTPLKALGGGVAGSVDVASPLLPSGTPVSSALKLPRRGRNRLLLSDTLDSIDAVHGDGDLPEIPIRTETGKRNAIAALYRFKDNGNPRYIKVNMESREPQIAFVHEIGHFLDHQGVGLPGEFASEADGLFSEWRRLVADSDAVSQLRRVRANPSNYEVSIESTGLLGKTRVQRVRPSADYIDYLLDDRELWAQCYTQYVATRSGNEAMLEQVEALLNDSMYNRQWQHDDFEPIASAIDNLFLRLGWLK